jgi:hypothetical protein
VAEFDPQGPSQDANPYAPPQAELKPRDPAYYPSASRLALEPFSIDAVLRHAWALYKQRYGIVMALVWGALGINWAYSMGGNMVLAALVAAGAATYLQVLFQLVFTVGAFVLQTWILPGQTRALLKVARREDATFNDLFQGGRFFLRYILASILYVLILLPIFIASAIPAVIAIWALGPDNAALGVAAAVVCGLIGFGFVVAISTRLYLFPYVLVDRDCGAVDALRISFDMTRGLVLELIALALLAGLIAISGLLACGVGLIFTVPLAMLIAACAYALIAGPPRGWLDAKPRNDLEILDFES